MAWLQSAIQLANHNIFDPYQLSYIQFCTTLNLVFYYFLI